MSRLQESADDAAADRDDLARAAKLAGDTKKAELKLEKARGKLEGLKSHLTLAVGAEHNAKRVVGALDEKLDALVKKKGVQRGEINRRCFERGPRTAAKGPPDTLLHRHHRHL